MSTSQINERLFDEYSTTYEDTVNASIARSGESVEFFARAKAALVAAHLHAIEFAGPRTVLDLGCGTGLSTRTLAEALPSASLVGVDVSGESIGRARRLDASPRSTYVHYSGERLPFDDASFDVAFSACVFHHIDRGAHVALLREIRRVLRPGGMFFLFEHNPRNPLTVRAVKACEFDEGVILLDPSYARRTMDAAGLADSSVRYYFFFPRALRLLRPLERLLGWLPLGAQYYVAARAGT